MRGHAANALVVGAREIAAARPFDLDHTCTQICKLPGTKRRRNRVLERDDGDAIQRSHDVFLQKDLGSPSRCSATYEKMRLVEIGATW
jgi:hypothetical protein